MTHSYWVVTMFFAFSLTRKKTRQRESHRACITVRLHYDQFGILALMQNLEARAQANRVSSAGIED